jgi:hypothetical protein
MLETPVTKQFEMSEGAEEEQEKMGQKTPNEGDELTCKQFVSRRQVK